MIHTLIIIKMLFADTALMDLFDMSMVNKPMDSIFNAVKTLSKQSKRCSSSVEVVTTLKPEGKDETWVCVWAKKLMP